MATLLVTLLRLGCSAPAPDDTPRRPNFLIVSIDTLRADHVGCYGYGRETTPALDRLAREGVAFTGAVANSPWTLPSHGSLMTGLYPRSHGLKSFRKGLREEIPTLASVLLAEGYATRAVVNSLYLSPHFGLLRGFQEHRYFPERIDGRRVRSARDQVDLAIRWLGELDEGPRPFLFFLHNYDVHSDYDPSRPYLDMFASPYEGNFHGTQAQLRRIREGKRKMDEADIRHMVDLYDAGIREWDDQLGRLLEFLDDSGIAETTHVIVLSDHGEEFFDHGDVLHGRTMYEELLAVPLVIRGPGLPAGQRVEELAQLHDVFPTVLALAGVASPSSLEGTSLAAAWSPGGALDRLRLGFAEADHKNEENDIKRMVRRGPIKLIRDRLTGAEELYDLSRDPRETRDAAADHPRVLAGLRSALEEYTADEGEATTLPPLDREDWETLRSLGYVQ